MPKIQTFGAAKQTKQVVQSARASQVDSRSFGSPVADGLTDVANVANNIQKQQARRKAEEAQLKNNQDKIDAQAALLSYQQFELNTLSNPDTGYNNSRGLDAYTSLEGTKGELTSHQLSLAKSLSPGASSQFNTLVDKNNLSTYKSMNNHAAKGQRVHESSMRQTGINQSLEGASTFHNQREPERDVNGNVIGASPLDVQYQSGMFDIRAQQKAGELNVSQAEAIQDYSANFAKNVVMGSEGSEGMTESLKYVESRGWLANEPHMKNEINKQIEAVVKAEKAHEQAKYVQNTVAGYMSTKGHSPMTRGEALEAVANDPLVSDDPKLLDSLRKQVAFMYDAQDKAQDEDYGDTFDYFANGLYGKTSLSELMKNDPRGWETLSAKDRRALESGEYTTLDQNWWLRFNAMSKAEQAQVTNQDAAGHLDPKTMSVFRSKRQDAIESPAEDEISRTVSQRVTSTVNAIVPKATTGSAKDRRVLLTGFINQQIDQAATDKGGALTTSEMGILLDDITKNYVKEDEFLFFDFEYKINDKSDIDFDNLEQTQRILSSAGSFGNVENVISLQNMIEDTDGDMTEKEIVAEYQRQIQTGEIVPSKSSLEFDGQQPLEVVEPAATDAVTFRQFGSILTEIGVENETVNVEQMQSLYDHLINSGFTPDQITRELLSSSYKEAIQ